MNLYKILGVNKDATLAEIKKAYRKQSAKHHPDHGGEAKAFAELSLAYEVLSDSGKREQYDSCGSIPGMDPSPVVKIIHDSVLDVSANQVRDFVQSVRDVISSKRKKFVTQKDATNKAIEQIAKRIKTIKGGSDQGRSIMANVLEQHMAAGKQYLAHTESIIGHHDEAIELLEGVKCDDDLAWASAGMQFRTASSWGTNPAGW